MKLSTPARGAATAILAATVLLSIGACLQQPTPTPTACIKADPTIGYAPLSVTFDASCSSVPEGAEDVYHFQWEFEDRSEGTGQITSHTFTEPGTYTVAVIMINSAYEWVDIGTRVVTVLPTE